MRSVTSVWACIGQRGSVPPGTGVKVLLSGATQALVEDDLPAGARLLDLGRHRLKDFDRTEHIFQLVRDGLPTDFPALKTLAGQPDEATPFSGREDTLAAAAQAAVETGRWSWRRISAVLLALLVIAGAIVAVIALLEGGATSSVAVVPDSLAVVDPVANQIVYDIKPLGEGPGPIGVGDDGLWILSLNSKTLASVDPRTRELRSTQGIGGTPTNMAVGGREVWISDSCNSNTNPALIRYEHGLPENIEEVSLPPASGEAKPTQTVACGLAASGESVWRGSRPRRRSCTRAWIPPSTWQRPPTLYPFRDKRMRSASVTTRSGSRTTRTTSFGEWIRGMGRSRPAFGSGQAQSPSVSPGVQSGL